MDLVTVHRHKRNSKVLVDGTTYSVDERGVIKGVDLKHAKKLLAGKSWHEWDGKAPQRTVRQAGSVKLVTDSGAVLEPTPEDDAKPDKDSEGSSGDEAESSDDETASSDGTGLLGDDGAEADADAYEDPDIPEAGEEWPDPDERMSLSYLKAMAQGLEIDFHPRIGHQKLYERLVDELYDDEDDGGDSDEDDGSDEE